jgi:tetratricopeptide (TPR) repeat protein/tRNA A-37 threonylcarbamoyl transferase component Bud32
VSNHTWSRIGEVFHAALEQDPARRDDFVAELCGQDTELRAEVEAMLAAHAGQTRLQLEDRLLSEGEAPDPMLGATVGAYRLVGLLGRGGMGDVYLAERSDDQYERRVALKLLRPGLGGPAGRERFLRERQILAQLEHPNIAMLLDGGVTGDGRPYLVMQYVDGEPITRWCRGRGLAVRERLALFRTVCDTVQAAHNTLVVHRDLKPANILITDEGQVRLLDFGIAKLLDETEPGLTVALDRLLTPAHAAPEQVTGRAVTTATDVYALGVLMYELLTGEKPFDVDLSSAAAIERTICETAPVAPSARAGAEGRLLRGELDTIVLKALRKEPERRYQSARELGQDIANHLEGRPVLAQGDSAAYRLRKAAGRHRTALLVTVAFLAVIGWSLVSLTGESRRTAAERDRAVAERERADAVVDVFSDLMAKTDPASTPEGRVLGRDDFIAMLADAVDGLDDQPDVQARLLEMQARVYHSHGQDAAWLEALQKLAAYYDEHGGEPRKVAAVSHSLAMATKQVRGRDEAVPLLRASVARQREMLGPISMDLAIAMQDLAEALSTTAPDEAADLMNQSFMMSRALGAVDSLAVARAYNGLGNVAWARGDAPAAHEHYRKALDLLTPMLGDGHPARLTVGYNEALTLRRPGQLAEGEAKLRGIRGLATTMYGPRHPTVINAWEALGTNLMLQGRHDEALAAFDEAAALQRQAGARGGATTWAVTMGAVALAAAGRTDEALARFEATAAPSDAFEAAYGQAWRALALCESGALDQAQTVLAAALPVLDAPPPAGRAAAAAEVAAAEATLLLAEGRFAEAEAPARRALDGFLAEQSDLPRIVARSRGLVAAALAGSGRTDEARTILAADLAAALECGYLAPVQRRLLLAAGAAAGL